MIKKVIIMLRQPIITILAHVDHGKTTLLDAIRKTAVAAKEAGGITQSISSTLIQKDAIISISGDLLDKFNFKMTVPGLLFIDTPGHEAFTTLRKRGGSIADIAILVVDVMEGIKPQTKESIEILRSSKTPFVIAVNKIDRIPGWTSGKNFIDNYNEQSDEVKKEFEKLFYSLVKQMNDHGLDVERFDRIQDFTKRIAAVPISAKTGEGIAELLTIIIGLSQQFLKDQLAVKDKSEGMILEVKEVTGLGTTVDTIIYSGTVSKNDYLIIGGKTPQISHIRALLLPGSGKDMKSEKKFQQVDDVTAAVGVKISAPGMDNVVAGSPIRTAKSFEDAELLLEELEKEREETEIHTEKEGLILKADTLGGLEALINIFRDYPIKEASIGQITKKEIISAEANKNPLYRMVIGFNALTSEEASQMAQDKNIQIIQSDIIYRLIEDYSKWKEEKTEDMKQSEIEGIARPAKIKILPGCIFRASNPAIVGCEILAGLLVPGSGMMKEGKNIGQVKQVQAQGQNVAEAGPGEKVAVSIVGPTVGRQIHENDLLYSDISGNDYKILKKNVQFLSQSELDVLDEIFEIKRKDDPRYGL